MPRRDITLLRKINSLQSPTAANRISVYRAFLRLFRTQGTTFALFLTHAGRLSEFGARGELHLKRRSFARRRHHPDAAAVHFDDLLCDGEPEARTALGFGEGTVDLVELVEDPTLLVEWYAGPGVCNRDREMAVPRARGDAHLAGVGELDGVAHEIEQNLREALFVAEANRERLVDGRRERELLVLGKRLGGCAHGLDNARDGVFGHVQGELAGLDLGDIQHGIDEAQEVLAVGADAGECVQRLLWQRAVEALL